MTTRTIPLRPGRAVIAAVLALASTSAYTQDAAPVIVLPGDPVVAAPPPAVPSPVEVPEVAQTAAQPSSAEATATRADPAPVARTSRQARTTPAAASASRAQAVSSSLVVTSAPVTTSGTEVAPVAETAPLAEPAIDEVQPARAFVAVERQREDVTEALAKILGGLLIAGVSVGALVLLMRRRRRSADPYEPAVSERPVVRPEPAVAAPAMFASTIDERRHDEPPLPAESGAVALPRVAPADPVARGELLRRMVAAEPDRANPFTSPKARLRRARLILQSLGRKFESGSPRFDFSQYASHWPSLARGGRLANA